MSKRKRFGVSPAISQGITETIQIVENNSGDFRNTVIPIHRIEPDPENPRKLRISINDFPTGPLKGDADFDIKKNEFAAIQELANSIESAGLLHPIVVYKADQQYRIVAGERRYLASVLLGKKEIEARVFSSKPKGYKRKLVQWFENNTRKDLSLYERLQNIRDLLTAYQEQAGEVDMTPSVLKELTSMSLAQSSYYMTVINGPSDVMTAIKERRLNSLDKSVEIAKVTDNLIRQQLIEACHKGQSLKALKSLIQHDNKSAANKPKIQANTRGRAASRVTLGHTKDTQVVKMIIDAVLAQASNQTIKRDYAKVNWNKYDEVTSAFKQLVTYLEQQKA